jgi:UDP-glucose:(heptosyl)LPS alpha-1,3-glucosyltransferase
MRIAVCLNKYFPYGGMQRDCYAIVKEALARGYEVDIYTMKWLGNTPAEFQINIVPTRGLTNHGRQWYFSNYIKKVVSQGNYDIILGFNRLQGLDAFYAADVCYKELKKNSKLINFLNPRYHITAKLEKAVFGSGSATTSLFIAERQQEDYLTHYQLPKSRYNMLLPWIEVPDVLPEKATVRAQTRAEFNVSEQELMVLLVGSGFKIKGLDRALHAIAALPARLRDKVQFFVIGEDKHSAYEKLAKKLHVHKHVRFLDGRLDVPRFMLSADVLIHPAYAETAGKVLLEALALGLPILVTEVCGFAKYIKEADAGIVLPMPFEQAALNQALCQALDNSEQRETWQTNAINYVAVMQISDMPKQTLDLLERIASEKEIEQAKHLHVISNKGCKSTLFLEKELKKHWPKLECFEEIMQLNGELYRDMQGRKTFRFQLDGQSYFIKQHFGVGWREIAKNLLFGRLPVIGATTEYLAINRLTRLNIPTLSTAGFGVKGCNPATQRSFLITHEITNAISVEDLVKEWKTIPPSRQFKLALMQKIAAIVSTMHQNGLNHRDMYICHFLLKQPVTTDIELAVIDLHRVQIRKRTPKRWIVKDLGSLYFSALDAGLTQRDFLRFMEYYTGMPWRQALQEKPTLWQHVIIRMTKLVKRHGIGNANLEGIDDE